MYIPYLSQEAINDIKVNFSFYEKHFSDPSNEWFLDIFEKHGWLKNSKYEFKDIQLNYDFDFNISDEKNIQIIYDSLCHLPPAAAVDERIWSGLLFTKFWSFAKYRRYSEIISGEKNDILNTFFFMRGTKRSCFINCLSRLWWTGYLLYDSNNNDHYHLLNLICEKAYASNILLLSSSNFTSNKNIILGILDCLSQKKSAGETIRRIHFVESYKYFNKLGSVMLLDTFTREKVSHLTQKCLQNVSNNISK